MIHFRGFDVSAAALNGCVCVCVCVRARCVCMCVCTRVCVQSGRVHPCATACYHAFTALVGTCER